MKMKLAGAAAAFALGFALHAQAATVTYNFDITTSGYSDVVGSTTAPIDPLNVDFDVTFDPTQSYNNLPVTFVTP